MAVTTRITVAKMVVECYSSIAVLLVLLLLPLSSVSSFQQQQLQLQVQHHNVFKISTNNKSRLTTTTAAAYSSLSSSDDALQEDDRRTGCSNKNRREILIESVTKAAAFTVVTGASITALQSPLPASAADITTTKDIYELRIQIEMALKQINNIPELIQNEKWDSIRAILIEHPIYDCWNKNTPMLKSYADALGATPTGDELSALEQREELISHLRYLDMAVYNNVFNPISSEGTNGATKALIDSYYNDPIREYKASKSALEELIKLSE
ncbi:hypothetical protein FRACYDRAFT_240969 [Fragilariopsis cylindrus CCMP1102]|uniref:Uncharacterized protein n=1 Tax=Fragilariopsis cylindrus CCMP1102 TaxID=635003 RepID=A0A1E7F8C4_9STRA|nr:hypothetical protein FRACYDRAFT_240969 [Fragilariopsis cylindrus CCMP1102]|eukprot:OEU14430.1 hypothetical protein FRACYDRAFT_240969 [Fragilariopsis cylindrus CCMP1102]